MKGGSDGGGGDERSQRELFQQDIAIFKHIHRLGGWGGVGGWVEANNKAYSGLQLKACQLDRVWQNAYSHKEVTYLLQISKLLTMTMCQITGTSWS